MVIANVGDSRAVLATTPDDGTGIAAVQLTVDFKPNLPRKLQLSAWPPFLRDVNCDGGRC